MKIYIFVAVFLTYGLINYYIGRHGWNNLLRFIPSINKKLYWITFWLIAWSYIISRLGQDFLPSETDLALTWIGSYWLAAMFYFFIFLIFIDLIRLLDKNLGFLPSRLKQHPKTPKALALGIFLSVICILVYGSYNARNPLVNHYDLTISKRAGSLQQLHVVMISDLHLGKIVDYKRLEKLISEINELNPDLVLLAGDIIDSDINPFMEQKINDSFSQLRPKLGVFAVPGNHEYISGHVEEIIHNLQKNRIRMLRDQCVKVKDSFYIVGRDDLSRKSFTGRERQELSFLMSSVDQSLPIILLDHQPLYLDKAQALGVDLQLSGHTHRGQLFPNNIITQYIYEVDWGYLAKDPLQVVVSTGFGTWGPPIRVGNRSEIVDIVIHFKK